MHCISLCFLPLLFYIFSLSITYCASHIDFSLLCEHASVNSFLSLPYQQYIIIASRYPFSCKFALIDGFLPLLYEEMDFLFTRMHLVSLTLSISTITMLCLHWNKHKCECNPKFTIIYLNYIDSTFHKPIVYRVVVIEDFNEKMLSSAHKIECLSFKIQKVFIIELLYYFFGIFFH